MARTIDEIRTQYLTDLQSRYQAENVVFDPATLSKLDIENIVGWVVAFLIWSLENLFDLHVSYVNGRLSALKPHTLRWYANKSKEYQHGHALVKDEDYYNNEGLSEADIEAAKVVKYAAAVEVPKGIRIKIAGETNGDLAQLDAQYFEPFKAFMQLVKDAGTKLYFTNATPDSLKLSVSVYYNPLVLSGDGKRLDGTNDTPVQNAINEYLKTGVGFNGLFIPTKLTDKMQAVDGVEIPVITNAQARYGALPYQPVGVEYNPDAGYMRFIDPSDLTLTFIPHEPI